MPTRAEVIGALLAPESEPRSWTRGDLTFELLAPPLWADDLLTLDVRVTLGDEVIAEDRFNFHRPPLQVPDGTSSTCGVYQDAGGDRHHLTLDEYTSLPRRQQRALAVVPGERSERPNAVLSPREAIRDALYDTVRIVTRDFTKPHLMRRADGTFRGDTLTAYAGTADGYAQSQQATWTSTQDGPATSTSTAATTGNAAATVAVGPSYVITQFFMAFDTSSIADTATISAAVFTLFATGGTFGNADSTTAEIYQYDWGTSVTTGDYRDTNPSTNITNLTKTAHLALSSWTNTSGTGNAFVDDGAYSSINLTGETRVFVILARAYQHAAKRCGECHGAATIPTEAVKRIPLPTDAPGLSRGCLADDAVPAGPSVPAHQERYSLRG